MVVGLFRLGQRFRLIATLLPTLAAFVAGLPGLRRRRRRAARGPAAHAAAAAGRPAARGPDRHRDVGAGGRGHGGRRRRGWSSALVQLLLFTLGIVAASRLFDRAARGPDNLRVDELGWWAAPVGLVLISLGHRAAGESRRCGCCPGSRWSWCSPSRAQSLGQHVVGPVLGSFLGAVAASLGLVPGRGVPAPPPPAGGLPAVVLAAGARQPRPARRPPSWPSTRRRRGDRLGVLAVVVRRSPSASWSGRRRPVGPRGRPARARRRQLGQLQLRPPRPAAGVRQAQQRHAEPVEGLARLVAAWSGSCPTRQRVSPGRRRPGRRRGRCAPSVSPGSSRPKWP